MRLTPSFLFVAVFFAVPACTPEEVENALPALPVIAPVTNTTMGSYFVKSFAPYEAEAARLRNSVARYIVQQSTWHFPGAPNKPYTSYPLAAARVEYAHAVGLTGKGALIAMSDGGILARHETISGRTTAMSGTTNGDTHGTMVASVAAGSSSHMVGVAPGATILAGDFDSYTELTATATSAAQRGAVAYNNSWGYSIPATSSNLGLVKAGADGRAYINALTMYADTGVAVWAISNDETQTEIELMAGLPSLQPGLEDGWLAVGNAVPVFDNTRILSAERVSSQCFAAARWCIVADGAWEGASGTGPNDYTFATGSSFAAPQVSGALAILAEAFPTLTPHQLRLRLLASADNSFFTPEATLLLADGVSHGYNTEFGHGFLNLRAALLPIGPTTLSGTAIKLEDAAVISGTAYGDSVARALAEVDVSLTDALDSDFTVEAAALTTELTPEPMAARIASRSFGNPAPARFDGLSGQTLDLGNTAGDTVQATILVPHSANASAGLAFAARIGSAEAGLDLGVKVAQDSGELFGLGDGAAALAALTVDLRQPLGTDGFWGFSGEWGQTDAPSHPLLASAGTMDFDRLSVNIGQRNLFTKGDTLRLGVEMPMAVTRGTTTLTLPQPAAFGDAAAPVQVDLSPLARQINLQIGYDIAINALQSLQFDLMAAQNFGNVAGDRDSAAGVTYRIRF